MSDQLGHLLSQIEGNGVRPVHILALEEPARVAQVQGESDDYTGLPLPLVIDEDLHIINLIQDV